MLQKGMALRGRAERQQVGETERRFVIKGGICLYAGKVGIVKYQAGWHRRRKALVPAQLLGEGRFFVPSSGNQDFERSKHHEKPK